MKRKEHRFTVVVKNPTSRKCAELALLCVFAERMPDGCEFHLRKSAPKSERELAALRDAVAQTLREKAHLADGENCTLIRLKRALAK